MKKMTIKLFLNNEYQSNFLRTRFFYSILKCQLCLKNEFKNISYLIEAYPMSDLFSTVQISQSQSPKVASLFSIPSQRIWLGLKNNHSQKQNYGKLLPCELINCHRNYPLEGWFLFFRGNKLSSRIKRLPSGDSQLNYSDSHNLKAEYKAVFHFST